MVSSIPSGFYLLSASWGEEFDGGVPSLSVPRSLSPCLAVGPCVYNSECLGRIHIKEEVVRRAEEGAPRSSNGRPWSRALG